jgi:hypothetical protein
VDDEVLALDLAELACASRDGRGRVEMPARWSLQTTKKTDDTAA